MASIRVRMHTDVSWNPKNMGNSLKTGKLTLVDKMEAAFSAVADAIVWTDSECRVEWCNASFDRLTGRVHQEVWAPGLATFCLWRNTARAFHRKSTRQALFWKVPKLLRTFMSATAMARERFCRFLERLLASTTTRLAPS